MKTKTLGKVVIAEIILLLAVMVLAIVNKRYILLVMDIPIEIMLIINYIKNIKPYKIKIKIYNDGELVQVNGTKNMSLFHIIMGICTLIEPILQQTDLTVDEFLQKIGKTYKSRKIYKDYMKKFKD